MRNKKRFCKDIISRTSGVYEERGQKKKGGRGERMEGKKYTEEWVRFGVI